MNLDTGTAISQLLIKAGLINEKQFLHANRVRSKLAEHKTLLNTMLSLEYFTEEQLNNVLRQMNLEVRLGDLLVELGDITSIQLENALRIQKSLSVRKKLGEILIEQHYIKEKRLIQVLSSQLGFHYLDPDFNKIDKSLLNDIPPKLCEEYKFIPIKSDKNIVFIACLDPRDKKMLRVVKNSFHCKIIPLICCQEALTEAINKLSYYKKRNTDYKELSDEKISVNQVEEILYSAIQLDASDIHIETLNDKVRVRFRRDGVLFPFKQFEKAKGPSLIGRLKVLSQADIAERRRHQDGKFEFTDPSSGAVIDIRCSFYISIYGEKVCLRILKRKALFLNINETTMAPAVLERFKQDALDIPTGVVLITGPTGSGKTTTLYSCVDYLNNNEVSIITAEEPVEYVIDGITQCSLNPKIGLTFEETLRHMVRQDPDVIVLGEIRDNLSAEAAIQAALTGHKVLTTFHTEDTIGGLLRLMNMNIESFLISSTVISVLAQRLLRRVCLQCAQPYQPKPLELLRFNLQSSDLQNENFQIGKGCEQCAYTGYHGRIGVYELLVLNERVKDAILSNRPSFEIRRISIETSGLITLQEDGIDKASLGLTTLLEVQRMLPHVEKPRPLQEIKRLGRSYLL
ncbi:Flp pilus assembly complex ATPase component TadA [Zooshikella marina]|uniref:GspE/PulE family protein n=1 Tax=Zooshikella ganghwensis TaxID=202772 RepID=UPI001BB08E13|nr:GspE/PulE family protein [Zooshikella ganghwensis]MBU2705126.1 Flp pilus assembly complex ATPase component TadA [Zooshikella ganghwensis]